MMVDISVQSCISYNNIRIVAQMVRNASEIIGSANIVPTMYLDLTCNLYMTHEKGRHGRKAIHVRVYRLFNVISRKLWYMNRI